MPSIACEYCEREFVPKPKVGGHTQRFCSRHCRIAAYNRKTAPEGRNTSLSRVTIGAVGELLVCADLLNRGWSVFRAQSPSCTCDLVAMLGPILRRVEVKMARYSPGGSVQFGSSQLVEANYDILALVFPDGTIQYRWGKEQLLLEPK